MRAFRVLVLAGLAMSTTIAHAAELRITVNNVVPNQGELRVALFDRADGFPGEPEARLPQQELAASGESVEVVFASVPPGRWAAMVMQDLNGNKVVDTNFLGMPKEPYGASNNKLPRLSPPNFDDSSFTVGPNSTSITIDLRRP